MFICRSCTKDFDMVPGHTPECQWVPKLRCFLHTSEFVRLKKQITASSTTRTGNLSRPFQFRSRYVQVLRMSTNQSKKATIICHVFVETCATAEPLHQQYPEYHSSIIRIRLRITPEWNMKIYLISLDMMNLKIWILNQEQSESGYRIWSWEHRLRHTKFQSDLIWNLKISSVSILIILSSQTGATYNELAANITTNLL